MMNAAQKKIDLKSLKLEVYSLKKILLNLSFQKTSGQLEKTSEIKKVKRKIASLKTEIVKQKGNQDA